MSALTRYHDARASFGLGEASVDWGALAQAGAAATGAIASAVGSGISSAHARRAEEARAAAISAAVPWIVGGVLLIGGTIAIAVVLK